MASLFEVSLEHASDPELLTSMLVELERMSENSVYRRDVTFDGRQYRFVTEDPACDNNLGRFSESGLHLLCEVFEREYKAGRPIEFSFFPRGRDENPVIYVIGTAFFRTLTEFHMLRM